MRYLALACDYDGTLAETGGVNEETLRALERCRTAGLRLVLVTGRQLCDLQSVFSHLELFDRVVAENGALLYRPATGEEKLLGEAPPECFISELRSRNVTPLSVGKVIVATWQPNETAVIEIIRDQGLELHVIFNKGAVMVLPSGINKATGLKAALIEIAISPHNTVGVGDAENDHAFLSLCECSAAVASAVPTLRERADLVTRAPRGAGVVELIDELLETDLEQYDPVLKRPRIALGTNREGETLYVNPFREHLLVAGPSGGGKSSLATSIFESLVECCYQFCVVDPEGDYPEIDGAVVLGDGVQYPNIDEILALLEKPEQNAVVSLLGTPLESRSEFAGQLLHSLQDLYRRTGRPHWLVVDEAHQVAPLDLSWGDMDLTRCCQTAMFLTVHPENITPAILSKIRTSIAVGANPEQTLRSFGEAVGERPPDLPAVSNGEAWLWRRPQKTAVPFWVIPPRFERRRHQRKYAQGSLGPDKSFYFRGPSGKLNLRAQNLMMFLQLADGVDEETWLYHLRRGDYSRWFREAIKDQELAAYAAQAEALPKASASETRYRIREEIERRYTGPA